MKQETKTALITALELLLSELKEDGKITFNSDAYNAFASTYSNEGLIGSQRIPTKTNWDSSNEITKPSISDTTIAPPINLEPYIGTVIEMDDLQKSFLDEGKDIPEGKFRSNFIDGVHYEDIHEGPKENSVIPKNKESWLGNVSKEIYRNNQPVSITEVEVSDDEWILPSEPVKKIVKKKK